ncbi:DUF6119 family protein [Bacillus cereus]|uniref:TIGR04141 family sporadically distributed protein n=1 Tax=Bacillus cereus HuA3-9 TaxID=1053205 RepID=R8CMG8_BACCE|nr:DUF6119 family protein [Bacillus cereus]EOO12792.1 hypothetical protein IGA_04806 [Bacillus cereus HuA3-9]
MELSIYKQVMNREDFIDYLKRKNMERIGKTQKYTSQIVIKNEKKVENITIDFFFKLDNDEIVEIEWANYWSGFFKDGSKRTKTVESAFGMILLWLDNSLYTISLGRGYSYANSYADMDFGFDIAEIIYNEKSIEVKSAKFFKQSKSKSLTQYNVNSYVTPEIGESNELLVSKINIDKKYSEFLLSKYEDKMNFSSSVKISVNSYKPQNIIDIIHELHYIYKNEKKSGTLPRMTFLKNNEDNQPMFSDLNKGLLEAIKTGLASVCLSYYIEEDGTIFINPAKDDQVEIIYNKKTGKLDSYSIASIGEMLKELKCTDITKVSIKPVSNRNGKVKLLKVLDYSINYRGKEFCLYRGKWASFNQSYIDFIEKGIVQVNKCTSIYSEYNLTDEILKKGRKIQNSNKNEYDQVDYAEYPFNLYLKNTYNFILLDRKNDHEYFKSVEFADLYDEQEQALIHVKIGSTPDVRYCIQQSLHSAEIFNTQSDVLEVYGINRVKKVAMLLVLQTKNLIGKDGLVDFSKNNSIYLKIEIIDWLTKIRMLGYIPEILIARDLTKSKDKKKND